MWLKIVVFPFYELRLSAQAVHFMWSKRNDPKIMIVPPSEAPSIADQALIEKGRGKAKKASPKKESPKKPSPK
eukprot:gene35777-13138_t